MFPGSVLGWFLFNDLSLQPQITPDFIQETRLTVSLTPSRANGFYNIFKLMKSKANLYSNLKE